MDISGFISLLPIRIFFGLIVFGIVFGSLKYGNSKTEYNKLHKWSVALLVFGFVVMVVFGFSVLINKVERSSTLDSSSIADGFTIEEYKIVMDVNESNSIDVKEYITINFYESGHHGIYRFIPSWLEYTNKDGITQSRESKISNLRAIDDKYTIETVNGKKQIKIGDADRTLPIGNHNYEIDYTYDMGFDPYESFDEFIFHAFGDYWGTEIKNASLEIRLPKDFDSQKIKFFADKYRQKDITSYVTYYVSDNIIFADLSSDYKLNSALTIDVELPEGYFVNGSNNYGTKSLICCVLCVLFAIVSFLLWVKNGKNLDKVPEIMEFKPPEDLDAAEIGYLYKHDTGRKLSIALIVELASKGLIKIIESEDKKTQTIVKTNSTDVNRYIERKIKIKKLKEYKAPFFDNHYASTEIMKNYFPDKVTENVVTSGFDTFYEDSKYLVDNGYLKIESDSIDNYSEEQLDKIQRELNLNEFMGKPKMSSNEELVYERLFEDSDETDLSENHSFYRVFNEVAENVAERFDDKINDLKSYKYMLITSLGFLICTFLFGFAYCIFEDLDSKYSILYLVAFISNIIIFVFAILMKRKNTYGEEIKAKIKGFRNYIETAKKDQIETMGEQNPNYFYDILPYAYVLDVSKKWVERFEKIPTPTYDMGTFDYYNIDRLNSLSDSVYVPSSSGSSGGGGCSSCGGGCSSCGGGGSW